MVAMLVALRSPSGAKKLYLTSSAACAPVSRLGIVIMRTPRSRKLRMVLSAPSAIRMETVIS